MIISMAIITITFDIEFQANKKAWRDHIDHTEFQNRMDYGELPEELSENSGLPSGNIW